jgi:hypothetical protein
VRNESGHSQFIAPLDHTHLVSADFLARKEREEEGT